MTYVSVRPTAQSNILTLLQQLSDNDDALEASRVNMQGPLIAYKRWEQNDLGGGSYIYTISGRDLQPIPEVTLDFLIEEDGFYRIIFAVPGAVASTSPVASFYLSIADNEYPYNTSISTAYYWGVTQYPIRRYNSSGLYPPNVLQVDRWLKGGKTYSITGLVHSEPSTGTIAVPTRLNVGSAETAYIAIYKAGQGVSV